MVKLRFVLSLGMILVLLLSSCNLVRGTTDFGSGDGTTSDPIADQQTLVALAVQLTQAAADPILPAFTFTPSLSPTITLTITPEVPRVTVSQATNCRTGPGEPYDIVGVLPVGTPAEIVGKNSSGDTWIIKLPSNPAVTCWLWGQWGTVEGNTAGLTVFSSPPTPTSSADFSFGYAGFGVGPGYQCFLFNILLSVGATWESYLLSLENQTDGGLWASQADVFNSFDMWCAVTNSRLNVEPGEPGTTKVTTYMVASPAGDLMEAILTLCTGNGMTGYCMTKSYTFNP